MACDAPWELDGAALLAENRDVAVALLVPEELLLIGVAADGFRASTIPCEVRNTE
jgi:hypothetical protein